MNGLINTNMYLLYLFQNKLYSKNLDKNPHFNFYDIFEESQGEGFIVNKLDEFWALNLQITRSFVCDVAAYFYSNFQ